MSHVDVMLLLDEIQFSQTLRNFNNIILTFKKKTNNSYLEIVHDNKHA